MRPNNITMFLSIRTIVYLPQLFHFLEVVEGVILIFSYYVSDLLLHKITYAVQYVRYCMVWYNLNFNYSLRIRFRITGTGTVPYRTTLPNNMSVPVPVPSTVPVRCLFVCSNIDETNPTNIMISFYLSNQGCNIIQ